jgi:hypothetical protein
MVWDEDDLLALVIVLYIKSVRIIIADKVKTADTAIYNTCI